MFSDSIRGDCLPNTRRDRHDHKHPTPALEPRFTKRTAKMNAKPPTEERPLMWNERSGVRQLLIHSKTSHGYWFLLFAIQSECTFTYREYSAIWKQSLPKKKYLRSVVSVARVQFYKRLGSHGNKKNKKRKTEILGRNEVHVLYDCTLLCWCFITSLI